MKPNEPSAVPVDADALRQGLAGMRDTLAGVQLELETARRQLDEAAQREADLEAALLELRPTALRSSGGWLRRWSRRMRRLFERGIVRVTPRALVPFVWHNPLFDSSWYLERYPDVRSQRIGPERHYRRHGVTEGRDPNAFFGTSWYLARYPDVAASGINPLDHYHLYGASDGRDPSPWFHTRWYLAQNPDVAAAGIHPLLHFVRHGASEGRALRPGRASAVSLTVTSKAAVPSARHRSRPALHHQRGPSEPRTSLLDSVPRDRPIVLMLDDAFPRPDRDAGSVLAQQYVGLFQQLGYHVHFVALRDDGRSQRYRKVLAASGATVVDVKTGKEGVVDLLERDGARIDVAFLSRVSVAGPHIEEVARHCPSARIIFNTQDLHFLREERAAQLAGDRVGTYKAAALRELEIHVIRMADATIVVSSAEKALLAVAAPGAAVYWCPLIQDVIGRSNRFKDRSGIAFIGGYRHLPNVDAVRYFLDEVWPLIHGTLSGVNFYAIGADMPDEIRKREDEGFVAVGHVPDLEPWLERVRLTVAPLRFGAGMKGKVLSSLARGVPCIVSPIAAEGMETHDAGIVLAEDAPAFADAVVRLHGDEPAWGSTADAGLRWVEANVSVRRGGERLRGLLADLGSPLPSDRTSPRQGAGMAMVAE